MAAAGAAARRTACRLLVKPGITGLWQVNGRSTRSWDESVRLNLYYVENWSLGLDLTMLAKTVLLVARGFGSTERLVPRGAQRGSRRDIVCVKAPHPSRPNDG